MNGSLNSNGNSGRWLYGCLLCFIFSCTEKRNYNVYRDTPVDSLKQKEKIHRTNIALSICKRMIKPGDIITRTGNDFTSQSLRTLNRRDKTYSHCGIANIENDTVFIYHALGGEWNPDQRLKKESFESFTNPAENTAAGIFRFKLTEKTNLALISKARQFYREQLKFDMDFDLRSDDKMYCAEFIYKSFLGATEGSVRFNHSYIGDFEFVGVDDITADARCVKITGLDYRLY